MSPSKRFKSLYLAVASLLFSMLAWPAVGSAAETFGSRLTQEPNTGGCNGLLAPCTYVAYIHPTDPIGDPYSGGAPRDGVIVKFKIRATGPGGPGDPATVTFGVAELDPTDAENATAKSVAYGPTVTLAGSGDVEEFPARLRVKKGEQVAIRTSDARAIYASSGDKFTFAFSPALVEGGPAKASSQVTDELLVAAVIEADADKDGWGDETQDKCVGNPGSDEGCPTPKEIEERTAPKVTGVAVSPRSGPGARTITFRLNKGGKVTIRVERLSKGRRVAGKCRKPSRANRSRRACNRAVKLPGKITKKGGAGLNRVTLGARFKGRKLTPGRYRLVVKMRDNQGRVSRVVKVGFRVTRR